MRALFVGFGNVGRQVARLLGRERGRFPGLRRLEVAAVGVVTLHRGCLANPEGVDLERGLGEVEETGRFSPANPDFAILDAARAVEELDYDVLVELSPLNIADHGEPAASRVRQALRRGRHVVSANKGPLAFHFRELIRLARQQGVQLLFESTVMDGAPIFNLARSCLLGCQVVELAGILNSTSTFVLSRMEKGDSLQQAVVQAQSLGVAETDPNHDLEGWDAAAKICVLANALMDADLTPLQVVRQGILRVGAPDLESARSTGKRLRLVSRAALSEGRVVATVGVEPFPAGHSFAVEGTGSVLRISTDLMTPLVIRQENPTLYDTAYGVLSDLLEIDSQRSLIPF